MAKLNVGIPEIGNNDKETIQNLFDNVLALRREVDFALLNLDDDNIPSLSGMASAIEANTEEFLTLGDLATLDSITSTNIDDNSITTPKLAAGSVIASKMSVGSLSAISANLGTIYGGVYNTAGGTADRIVIGESGYQQYINWKDSNSDTSAYIEGEADIGALSIHADSILYLNSVDVTLKATDDVRLEATDEIQLYGKVKILSGTIPTYNGANLATQSWVSSQGYSTSSGISYSQGDARYVTSGGNQGDVDILHTSYGITIRASEGSITLPWD